MCPGKIATFATEGQNRLCKSSMQDKHLGDSIFRGYLYVCEPASREIEPRVFLFDL